MALRVLVVIFVLFTKNTMADVKTFISGADVDFDPNIVNFR